MLILFWLVYKSIYHTISFDLSKFIAFNNAYLDHFQNELLKIHDLI